MIHEIDDKPLEELPCYKTPQNFIFLFFLMIKKNIMLVKDRLKNHNNKSLILAWKSMSRTCHKHQWLFEETQTCYHLEVW